MLLKSHTTLIRFLFILNLTYQKNKFLKKSHAFPSAIINWKQLELLFHRSYCSQQKDFSKKEWNPNYFAGLCDL